MRETLQATTAEHVHNFHFHLNDNCPSIVARNIMILKILSAQDFDPNKEEDFSFLWDVWYNTEWPEITRKRFLIVLKMICWMRSYQKMLLFLIHTITKV
jgi:hypothetical protein